MFGVTLSSACEKFLKKSDHQLTARPLEKIEKLQSNPFHSGVNPIVNRKEKIFRVRVGDYRIHNIVILEKNLIFISDIEKMPRAYD